jgi:inhibitor of KinA sporulation pathway (predicted exonuclease)
MVDKGINYLSATEQLVDVYLSRQRTWISYGDYDRKMFINMSRLHQVPYPFGPTHINIKNLFAVKHCLKKEVGLSRALEMAGEKFEGVHHRANDDSINIAKIVKAVLYGAEISG